MLPLFQSYGTLVCFDNWIKSNQLLKWLNLRKTRYARMNKKLENMQGKSDIEIY
jgi:hypothetical protein